MLYAPDFMRMLWLAYKRPIDVESAARASDDGQAARARTGSHRWRLYRRNGTTFSAHTASPPPPSRTLAGL